MNKFNILLNGGFKHFHKKWLYVNKFENFF